MVQACAATKAGIHDLMDGTAKSAKVAKGKRIYGFTPLGVLGGLKSIPYE